MREILKTTNGRSLAGALCAMFLIACFLPGLAAAQDLFAGNIKAVEAKNPAEAVKIIRIGFTGVLSGKPGDAVFAGDTLKTGAAAKAQIGLSDGTVLVLGPNSGMQIRGYQVERYQAKRNIVMKTFKGTVRFAVSRLFKPHPAGAEMSWKDSSVTIETMNCIAGVRGTEFMVTVTKDETEIAVIEGAVSLRGTSPALRGEVIVGADRFSSARRGEAPSQSAAMSAERLAVLTEATTLKNPVTSMNGNGKKKNGKTYSGGDLSNDIATGMPLGEALDKAVQSGLPLEDATCAAISDAGVDPGAVVYTAVVEGYPVNKIVESCVKCGAPLNGIVSSALAAGGEKKLIIVGAQDAGSSPSSIANAFANAGSPTAPVAGGGAGAGGAVSPVMIPASPIPIGGGGGAPASTRSASPYRP